MSILSNFNKAIPICTTCIHNGECGGTVCYGYESEQKGTQDKLTEDLISREALKKTLKEKFDDFIPEGLYDEIDNAPTVSSEITEKQAILLLINNGWLVNHDKELREKWERPQAKCENCNLYFRAITKEENKPLNWLDRCDDDHLSDN